MTEERNRWIDAVTQMIKLTREKKLTWTAGTPNQRTTGEAVTPPYFTAYKDRRLRLQEVTITHRSYAARVMDMGGEKREIILEFVDEYNNSLWRFPTVAALRDLLATVQYQVANVSDFLNDILEE